MAGLKLKIRLESSPFYLEVDDKELLGHLAAMEQRILAAVANRKPDKPKMVSPFLRKKEAIELLKTRATLEACERAGWLTASTRRARLVLYPREQVLACVYRLSQGEYPG